jgi:hypothetical protein
MDVDGMTPDEYLGCNVPQVFAAPELRQLLSEPEVIAGDTYFGARSLGVSFVAEGGRVVAVHVHVLPEMGYRPYSHPLSHGLQPEMTRQVVRGLLGVPYRAGEQTSIPVLGASPAWDLFEVDCVCLNVQYRLEGPGLSLLSFMLPEAVPE